LLVRYVNKLKEAQSKAEEVAPEPRLQGRASWIY